MKSTDTVVRAELSRVKVQLHQMTTALLMAINALDVAFKSTERVVEALSTSPHRLTREQAGVETEALRQARGQILSMRILVR